MSGEGLPLVKAVHLASHLETEVDHPVLGAMLQAMARGRKLVRYDPRGFGLSDRDAGDFSLQRHLEDFAAVVPLESRNHALLPSEPALARFAAELDAFLAAPSVAPAAAGSAFDELTRREREVLEQPARGLGNAAIGERVGMSEKTVRNNVSAILAKLDVHTRSAAIVKAREAGFGVPPAR